MYVPICTIYTVYTTTIHGMYNLLAWENNFKEVKIHSQLGLNLTGATGLSFVSKTSIAVAVPKLMILRADGFCWIRGMFYFINSINKALKGCFTRPSKDIYFGFLLGKGDVSPLRAVKEGNKMLVQNARKQVFQRNFSHFLETCGHHWQFNYPILV